MTIEHWLKERQKAQVAREVATDAVNRAEEELEKLYLADAQKYVGKCYKYPNSDGGSTFPTYFKIKAVEQAFVAHDGSPNFYVSVLTFSDYQSRISVDVETTYLHIFEEYPITSAEFEKAYKKAMARIAA